MRIITLISGLLLFLVGSVHGNEAENTKLKAVTKGAKLLAHHSTIAVFEGVHYRICRGETGTCPERCGSSGEFAKFTIKHYIKLEQRSPNHNKQGSYAFQLSDFHKKPKVGSRLRHFLKTTEEEKFRTFIKGLKKGDLLLLSWNHECNGVPTRPLLKLDKISKDEAAAIIKEVETKNELAEQTKKSGEFYRPEAFARRLMVRYPKRFANIVPESFVSVKELNFKGLHVDEDDLISISKLSDLESLNFDGCKEVGKNIEHICKLRNLKELNLKGVFRYTLKNATKAPDAMLASLVELENLQKLNLRYIELSDSGFTHMGKFKQLRHLEMSAYGITDKGLAVLSNCSKLETLIVEHVRSMVGTVFSKLSKLPNLRILSLRGGTFSEELFPSLAKLTSLVEVDLWAAKGFSAKHIDSLASLKNLKKLNLIRPYYGRIPFLDDEVKSLRSALPQCEIKVGKR